MEHPMVPEPQLYLKKGCAKCDLVDRLATNKNLQLTRKFVDDSRWMDELSHDSGGIISVPCLREGGRFLFDTKDISDEIDRISAYQQR